jgi:hypothetical protein
LADGGRKQCQYRETRDQRRRADARWEPGSIHGTSPTFDKAFVWRGILPGLSRPNANPVVVAGMGKGRRGVYPSQIAFAFAPTFGGDTVGDLVVLEQREIGYWR